MEKIPQRFNPQQTIQIGQKQPIEIKVEIWSKFDIKYPGISVEKQ